MKAKIKKRKNRQIVLGKISRLEERYCDVCAIPKSHEKERYCLRKCVVGKELQLLGNALLGGDGEMNKKTNREIVFELLEKEKTAQEIIDKTGIPKTTVYTYRTQYNRIKNKNNQDAKGNKSNAELEKRANEMEKSIEKYKEKISEQKEIIDDYGQRIDSLSRKAKLAETRADEYQEMYKSLLKDYRKEKAKHKHLLAYLTLDKDVI